MAETFTYDVFLSYSSKDKAAVRAVAEKLWADGARPWRTMKNTRRGGL